MCLPHLHDRPHSVSWDEPCFHLGVPPESRHAQFQQNGTYHGPVNTWSQKAGKIAGAVAP